MSGFNWATISTWERIPPKGTSDVELHIGDWKFRIYKDRVCITSGDVLFSINNGTLELLGGGVVVVKGVKERYVFFVVMHYNCQVDCGIGCTAYDDDGRFTGVSRKLFNHFRKWFASEVGEETDLKYVKMTEW